MAHIAGATKERKAEATGNIPGAHITIKRKGIRLNSVREKGAVWCDAALEGGRWHLLLENPKTINQLDISLGSWTWRETRGYGENSSRSLNNLQKAMGFNRGIVFPDKIRFLYIILYSPRQKKRLPRHAFSCFTYIWATVSLPVSTGLLSIVLTWLLPACRCRELAGPGFCRVYSWCHLILLVLFSHIKCACRNGLVSSSCLEPAYSSPEYVTFRLISYPEGKSGGKTSGGNCIPYEERLDERSQFLQRWIFRKVSMLNKTLKNSTLTGTSGWEKQ